MTFDQFNKFIIRLSQLARDPVPGFSIIKDIFDFIDIRRDGIIDMNEWMQTFKGVERYEVRNQKLPHYKRRKPQTANRRRKNLPRLRTAAKRQINFAAWEISLDYENVIKAIGRNRKTIDIILTNLEKSGTPIDFTKAKEVITEVLSASGINV